MIHPGRAKRLGETADEDGAVVAEALVAMVVRDIAATRVKERGLTAEQISKKFESDPGALGIAGHLLAEASDAELQRLLLDVVPSRYFETSEEPEPDESLLVSQGRLFRAAFEAAGLKEAVMARYVEVVRKESGPRVQVYEETFFRGGDLEYVQPENRALLIDHILSRAENEPSQTIFAAMAGIGSYLKVKDGGTFVDRTVNAYVYRKLPQLVAAARSRLVEEYRWTTPAVDKRIVSRLEAWVEPLRKTGGAGPRREDQGDTRHL